MDRWTGVLKVPVCSTATAYCRIAASLCISPSSKALTVPTANAIFFNGDRVEGTGNPVIERLSDVQNIAEILTSKFGPSINAWVVEASTFNGPFAVYEEFLSSVNWFGEPQSYKPNGFLASTSVVSLLSNFLEERAKSINKEPAVSSVSCSLPRTLLLGFSKGGVVLNQLVAELGFVDNNMEYPTQQDRRMLSKTTGNNIVPDSIESFLDSISEIHYVDVGLNSTGAYLTDDLVVKRIAKRLIEKDINLRFMLHGTPRQWKDMRRGWIREEKDKLVGLLDIEGQKSKGKLQVCERMYFGDKSPDLQMHFEIIEKLLVNWCKETN